MAGVLNRDAEVVLEWEAVSGGGASMQTGNTLEWRSVASFHKQHHRRVPDIYDLWSEWQHRPWFQSKSACLPYRYMAKSARPYSLIFPRWKHQTLHMVVRELGLKQVILYENITLGQGREGRGHHGKAAYCSDTLKTRMLFGLLFNLRWKKKQTLCYLLLQLWIWSVFSADYRRLEELSIIIGLVNPWPVPFQHQ